MKKAKILVVDDNELVLLGFKKALEGSGYDLSVTTDPKKAVAMAKKELFDLVFTDLKMEKLSGREVCAEVKKNSPSTEVVIFSGSPGAIVKDQVEILEVGGKDYFLRKPLSTREILDVVTEILERKNK